MKVLGLSGKAGTGKDFVYENVLRTMEFKRWALADHFKIWLYGIGEVSYEDVFFNKPPAVRDKLQQYGTEDTQPVYGNTIWCRVLYGWLRTVNERWGVNRFVITDVRFPHEVEYIQNQGGKVVRIAASYRAMRSGLSIEAQQHISETALDDFYGFDGILFNGRGTTVQELRDAMREMLKSWGWE